MTSTDRTPTGGPPEIDVTSLRQVLDGRWAEAREEARMLMADYPLPAVHELTTEEYREEIHAYARRIADRG